MRRYGTQRSVDFIFYKGQLGYSPDMVFDTVIMLRDAMSSNTEQKEETEFEDFEFDETEFEDFKFDETDVAPDEINAPLHEIECVDTPANTEPAPVQDISDRIGNSIECEFRALGISPLYKGYDYLFEAILYLTSKDKGSSKKVINMVAEKMEIKYSSATRAMLTAIEHAWTSGNPQVLAELYTARVDVRTKVPTVTEFVFHVSEKIRKAL